jgi:hypothetical protein
MSDDLENIRTDLQKLQRQLDRDRQHSAELIQAIRDALDRLYGITGQRKPIGPIRERRTREKGIRLVKKFQRRADDIFEDTG